MRSSGRLSISILSGYSKRVQQAMLLSRLLPLALLALGGLLLRPAR
jgi:hypothetical protein